MESRIIFTAFVQSAVITIFIAFKISMRNLQSFLFCILMFFFTLVLLRFYIVTTYRTGISSLELPIWYGIGPLFYYFIRFSLVPTHPKQTKWMILFFIPSLIEIITSFLYWTGVFINNTKIEELVHFSAFLSKGSFRYFCAFLIAILYFLITHNPVVGLTILYKKQLRWIQVSFSFLILFILSELYTPQDDFLLSDILAFVFINVFTLVLLNNVNIFSKDDEQGDDLLKIALNESEKAVLITNREYVIEYVNEPFLKIIGYPKREVTGRKASFLQGELTDLKTKELFAQKLTQEAEFNIEIINYKKNGESYLACIDIIPVFSAGSVSHYIAYKKIVDVLAKRSPTDEELNLIKRACRILEETKLYQNQELQLADVAKTLEVSPQKLRETLKITENKSFPKFINALRIEAALIMLRDDKNQHLTIEAIAHLCGYKSKSSFNIAFKAATGTTPKAFLTPNS
jgi:PAS domain S-box-containing protein